MFVFYHLHKNLPGRKLCSLFRYKAGCVRTLRRFVL
jgi:hypothetical protein